MDEGTGRCAFIPDNKLRSSVRGFGSKPSKTTKQIKQKAAKITKGLGTNCASTECKTKFSQGQ